MNFRRPKESQFLYVLEIAEPAPGRENVLQAQGGLATSGWVFDSKPNHFQLWQFSLFLETQSGDVLQGPLPPRGNDFLL